MISLRMDPRELLSGVGALNIPPEMQGAVRETLDTSRRFAERIGRKHDEIHSLQARIKDLYTREDGIGFAELGAFEGYTSLQYFHQMGVLLDKNFGTVLRHINKIPEMGRRRELSFHQGIDPQELMNSINILKTAMEALATAVKPFEEELQGIYRRSVDQYRFLQKRFLDMGADEAKLYKKPWEQDDHPGGFDLDRVPYVKIELIRDNPVLTDLLLDMADRLPARYTRSEKIKGKRKPRQVQYMDEFEVDRAARILIELSDSKYRSYVDSSRDFMEEVSGIVHTYHQLIRGIQPIVIDYIGSFAESPVALVPLGEDIVQEISKPLIDPSPMVARVRDINLNNVRPREEDSRPTGQIERRYFTARKKLLEHLATTLDRIDGAEGYLDKLEIAKAAVEKDVDLRETARTSLETKSSLRLKNDRTTENEFYTGGSGEMGAFAFERAPAPTVRLKDVHGASFDSMKEHLADLADYSKYLALYGATAPRGRVRSNLLAIGPYGCGKTEIGRAIAGDQRFIGAEVAVSNLLTAWFGEFEKNVDRVWDAASELRKASGDSKLVFLLMDEFDSWFGNTNGHWVDRTYSRVQKTLQMKLDGVVDYEGVIVVGFTNEPKNIPLAIYRRFKFVEVVGELEADERSALLKHFLGRGLPLSTGFRKTDYEKWGKQLEGATGDVIGKVADEVHYELMRDFIAEHPGDARRLESYIRRTAAKGEDLNQAYIKRAIGRHMKVTPQWVDSRLDQKLSDPIIREQIDTAVRVYGEAREVLSNLYTREDAASGSLQDRPHESGERVPVMSPWAGKKPTMN